MFNLIRHTYVKLKQKLNYSVLYIYTITMYNVYNVEYCREIHKNDNEHPSTPLHQYCSQSPNLCHIMLYVAELNFTGRSFTYNFCVLNHDQTLCGGKVADTCTIEYPFELKEKKPPFRNIGYASMEELLPHLELEPINQKQFMVRKCHPLDIKIMVRRILKDYAREHAPPVPNQADDLVPRWIINAEYTEAQRQVEHPFFGNISKMVEVRMAAVDKLRQLVANTSR
jgi:hypothetical protein